MKSKKCVILELAINNTATDQLVPESHDNREWPEDVKQTSHGPPKN